VRDLAAEGFPLAGGRLDYLGGRPVAALVFQRARHVVQVYVWPEAGEAAPTTEARAGYTIIAWREGGMAYRAVSDIPAADLADFVAQFRAAR
jgi:anti-sigma factor RsiW